MIREADKKDAAVLKGLWIKSLKNEKQMNNNIDLRSEIKDFNKDFPKLFKKNKYFLAEEDGRIFGFIGGEIKIGSGFFLRIKESAQYMLCLLRKNTGTRESGQN